MLQFLITESLEPADKEIPCPAEELAAIIFEPLQLKVIPAPVTVIQVAVEVIEETFMTYVSPATLRVLQESTYVKALENDEKKQMEKIRKSAENTIDVALV
jgi:hypothetical protein